MRLAILTALWGRPEVSGPCLAHAADHLRPALASRGDELLLQAVGSKADERDAFGTDPEALALASGWGYADAPNRPVSSKWNAGMEALRDRRPDAVVILGSDDVCSVGYLMEAMRRLDDGAAFVLSDRIVFAESAGGRLTGRAFWGRFARLGGGRVLSASLLDRLGWRPWIDGLDRRLDGSMDRRIHGGTMPQSSPRPGHREPGVGLPPSACRTIRMAHPAILLGVKSETNVWSYDHVRTGKNQHALGAHAFRNLVGDHFPALVPLLPAAPPEPPPSPTQAPPMAKQNTNTNDLVSMRAVCSFRNNAYEGTVRRGEVFETTAARAAALQKTNRAVPVDAYEMPGPSVTKPAAPSKKKGKADLEDFDPAEQIKHVGGGYYEVLSGEHKGERAKGKKAALKLVTF